MKFVKSNFGFCPECESSFVEDIETPSPSTHIESPRKREGRIRRLNFAMVVRGGDGGEEIGKYERYIDLGSGLQPCSPSMYDAFKESRRIVTKFAQTRSNGRPNSCPVCRHELPSDTDGGLTAPGAPRIVLLEVNVNDRSINYAVRKICRTMFSFFRGNSSSSSSASRGTSTGNWLIVVADYIGTDYPKFYFYLCYFLSSVVYL
ncbi:hypothetical protein MKX03_027285 [Papaver bracteatum]|nr:hypothetical protein MKX03_027285 [Papaver bracteatum]